MAISDRSQEIDNRDKKREQKWRKERCHFLADHIRTMARGRTIKEKDGDTHATQDSPHNTYFGVKRRRRVPVRLGSAI